MVAAQQGPLLVLTQWSRGRKQKSKFSNLQWDVNFAAYRSREGVQAEKRDIWVNGRDFQNREETHSK